MENEAFRPLYGPLTCAAAEVEEAVMPLLAVLIPWDGDVLLLLLLLLLLLVLVLLLFTVAWWSG